MPDKFPAPVPPPALVGHGGRSYSPEELSAAILRAEVVEVANRVCLEHSPKVVDAILARFDVTRKPIKEKAS